MFNPDQSLIDQVQDGLVKIWPWVKTAGAFGVGFLIGSAFFKPIVDFLVARLMLKKVDAESNDALKEIARLKDALAASMAEVRLLDARLKQTGSRRYLTGSLVGLFVAAGAIGVAYLYTPRPLPPRPPSPNFVEGYSSGFSAGLSAGYKRAARTHNAPKPLPASISSNHSDTTKLPVQSGASHSGIPQVQ